MSIREYLPSSTFQKVVIIIVIIVGVVFGIAKFVEYTIRYSNGKNTEALVPIVTLGVGELVETDTDNDGLKDWEEQLWQLDPENPDTDGNGVSDGEEIANLQNSIVEKSSTNTDATEELNQTDEFTRELFSIIIALQENGELTDQSSASITEKIVSFIESKPSLEKYVRADLTIVANTSENSMAYIIGYGNALTKYPIKSEDTTTLGAIVVTPDSTMPIASIEQVGVKYHSLKEALIKIPVPDGEVDAHLALINSVNEVAAMFTDVANYPIDPVPALASLYQSNTILTGLVTSLETIEADIYAAGGFSPTLTEVIY